MRVFKTVSTDLRDEMAAIGFTYIIERINGEEWFSFVVPEEESAQLEKLCFSHGNFIIGDTISF